MKIDNYLDFYIQSVVSSLLTYITCFKYDILIIFKLCLTFTFFLFRTHLYDINILCIYIFFVCDRGQPLLTYLYRRTASANLPLQEDSLY